MKRLRDDSDYKASLIAIIALVSYMLSTAAFAESTTVSVTNAGDMLKRITSQFPAIMELVTAFAYVAGFTFIFGALLKMKRLGEMRTMMMQERSVAGPLIYLFIGAALIYLPGAVNVGLGTFFSDPNPYSYLDSSEGEVSSIINACFMAVQLFGTVAFIRGLLIISHLANQGGGHQGSLGRGMTHIIGGIFCINIYEFIHVVLSTIGVEISGF